MQLIIFVGLLVNAHAQSTSSDVCLSDSTQCKLENMRTTIEQQAIAIHTLQTRMQQLSRIFPGDCADIYRDGQVSSGVYQIYAGHYGDISFKRVYCDMTTDGGGWTVIQRRFDGSENFNRSWEEFKQGFGDVSGEHWLGNEYLHYITTTKDYILRFDLEDWEGETRNAVYLFFRVSSEADKYRLDIGEYSGTAGDSGEGFSHHDNAQFSTWDQTNDNRNDESCISFHGYGGFWLKHCLRAGVNNHYSLSSNGHGKTSFNRIRWDAWHGQKYSLKATKMIMRPVDF